MPRPSHTSSFVVQLAESNRKGLRDIDRALRALPGVEDVVILSDADTAYLKVDYQHFDSAQLGQFAFVKA